MGKLNSWWHCTLNYSIIEVTLLLIWPIQLIKVLGIRKWSINGQSFFFIHEALPLPVILITVSHKPIYRGSGHTSNDMRSEIERSHLIPYLERNATHRVCLHTSSSMFAFVFAFGWFYGTIQGPQVAQNAWIMFWLIKKYFATLFSIISFQFLTNKWYSNTPRK